MPGVTIQSPAKWYATGYYGDTPSTVYPLLYFNSVSFVGLCASPSNPIQEGCNSPGFPAGFTTPSDGVLIMWRQDEFPASESRLRFLTGPDLSIAGHRARIEFQHRSGCPGATSEMDAFVARDASEQTGVGFELQACFGPHATLQDRREVQAMIESLRIRL